MRESTINYLGCFPRRVDAWCRAPCCPKYAGCFCTLVFNGQIVAVALCLPHGRAADARIRGLLDGRSREKAVCLLGMVTGKEHRKAKKNEWNARNKNVGKRFSDLGDPVLPRGRYVGYS